MHLQKTVVVLVQVDDVVSTHNSFWISGNGDDVFENNVVGQEVEVVLTMSETFQSFSNDAEEGAVSSKISSCPLCTWSRFLLSHSPGTERCDVSNRSVAIVERRAQPVVAVQEGRSVGRLPVR